MTFIQASGSGSDTKAYLTLETTSSGSLLDKAFWMFIYDASYQNYIVILEEVNWNQTYISSNMDAVYLKNQTKNSCYVLKPNRKILVEFQFFPNFDMSAANNSIKLKLGLRDIPSATDEKDEYYPRSDLITATYHWENDHLFGQTEHKESVLRAIIENTESTDKAICIYLDDPNDSTFLAGTQYWDDNSRIKFTQLD